MVRVLNETVNAWLNLDLCKHSSFCCDIATVFSAWFVDFLFSLLFSLLPQRVWENNLTWLDLTFVLDDVDHDDDNDGVGDDDGDVCDNDGDGDCAYHDDNDDKNDDDDDDYDNCGDDDGGYMMMITTVMMTMLVVEMMVTMTTLMMWCDADILDGDDDDDDDDNDDNRDDDGDDGQVKSKRALLYVRAECQVRRSRFFYCCHFR